MWRKTNGVATSSYIAKSNRFRHRPDLPSPAPLEDQLKPFAFAGATSLELRRQGWIATRGAVLAHTVNRHKLIHLWREIKKGAIDDLYLLPSLSSRQARMDR